MSFSLLSTGDNHWDRSSKRWGECGRVHAWIAERVAVERPDVFLGAGDLYERASVPEERMAVAAWLTLIAEACPVVLVKGNHDPDQDCALLARLRTRHPIIVVEDARVVYVAGAAIACVAWPDRARLAAAALRMGIDTGALEQTALRAILAGLGAELAAHDGPRIGLGHFMVDGSETSHGQPLIGHSMNVSIADLGLLNAHVTLMGHIHKPQEWEWNGAPILYCGTSYRTSYGETEEKSIVRAELDAGGLVSWQRVPTPCAGMVLIDAEWSWENWHAADDFEPFLAMNPVGDVEGAEVRIRYQVEADHRTGARAAAKQLAEKLLTDGAIDVKIEERVHTTTRARAPEIAAASGIAEKLPAYWNARSDVPASARGARLITMAQQLEHEVTNAA